MLRKKEREIRALKREKTAYKTVIAETSDKQLKPVFQSALTYTNSAIRDKSAEIKQFCADTGYRRDRFREQVGGKTSVGHGFGEFSKQNQKFNLKSGLTSAKNSDKINTNEMYRKKDASRNDYKMISEDTFAKLTIQARKNGAVIIRGTEEAERHLDNLEASASIIGDIILFRKEVCLSEVLEETYHFMQNKNKMNDDKPGILRTYLNEIDAKKYLIQNANKFKIPRKETELTKKQLKSYEAALKRYMEEHDNE